MLRLLTYNVHGCIGRSRRFDPGAILEVIESSGADVVALQEVWVERSGHDLPSMLDNMGYACVRHHVTLETSRGAYGILMMSKVEPTEVQAITLGGVEPRAALRFHLDWPGCRLDICGTHLGLSAAERWRQVEQIDGILADADDRYDDSLQVLMGDLNEWRPRTRFMQTVRQRFPWVSKQPTFPVRWPVIALDRIAIRGRPTSVSFRRLDAAPADRASDHRPLLAEIGFD